MAENVDELKMQTEALRRICLKLKIRQCLRRNYFKMLKLTMQGSNKNNEKQ